MVRLLFVEGRRFHHPCLVRSGIGPHRMHVNLAPLYRAEAPMPAPQEGHFERSRIFPAGLLCASPSVGLSNAYQFSESQQPPPEIGESPLYPETAGFPVSKNSQRPVGVRLVDPSIYSRVPRAFSRTAFLAPQLLLLVPCHLDAQ